MKCTDKIVTQEKWFTGIYHKFC